VEDFSYLDERDSAIGDMSEVMSWAEGYDKSRGRRLPAIVVAAGAR
jgi:hypothetical protein